MRCFFAVEIPDLVKSEILVLAKKYRMGFVSPSVMHLTLKFIGEVSEVEDLISRAKRIKENKFSIELKGVGCFPNKENPRIVWLGVGEGREELTFLAAKIDEVTKDVKENDRAEFVPHLTISRCRDECNNKIFYEYFKSSTFEVEEFVLMKTEFTNEGVKHSLVKSFRLI